MPNNKGFAHSPAEEFLSQAKKTTPLSALLNISKHSRHSKILFNFPATTFPIQLAACYQLQRSLVFFKDGRRAPEAWLHIEGIFITLVGWIMYLIRSSLNEKLQKLNTEEANPRNKADARTVHLCTPSHRH